MPLYLLVLCLFCFSSCQKQSLPYVKRALIERQGKKQVSEPRIDDPGEKELFLNASLRQEPLLQKKSYETIDQWVDRLDSLIRSQQNAIKHREKKLAQLNEREESLSQRVYDLSLRNEVLRKSLSAPLEKQARMEEGQRIQVASADFEFVLIRKNDTLFSIAMREYEDPEMVKEIAIWNQGWIRHPDDVLAGLSLILFPLEAKERNPLIVEQYLEKLRSYSQES